VSIAPAFPEPYQNCERVIITKFAKESGDLTISFKATCVAGPRKASFCRITKIVQEYLVILYTELPDNGSSKVCSSYCIRSCL
jgi:hypothetical protein